MKQLLKFHQNRNNEIGLFLEIGRLKSKKVVYGQEPPTECGFNYQLLAVITEVAQWGARSCSQPQPATDNGIRDGRSN